MVITEIGGTTGDIEGLPFLEAIRQFALEVGQDNTLFIHVTLVPFIKAAGELKSKPTQQSVAKLREIGIQPHVLICRTEHSIDRELRAKLSMFCNVTPEAVIEEKDVNHTIYEVPLMLQREKLDELVVRHFKLDLPPADMTAWRSFVDRIITPKHRVKIGVVGKYMENQDAYKSIYEALTHAGAAADAGVNRWSPWMRKKSKSTARRNSFQRPGRHPGSGRLWGARRGGQNSGSPIRTHAEDSLSGSVPRACRSPWSISRATCSASTKAHSTEFNTETSRPGHLHARRAKAGGEDGRHDASRRLDLSSDSRHENPAGLRHRSHDGTPPPPVRIQQQLSRENGSARPSSSPASPPDGKLVELIELADHPWFAACQFHPEFQSKPNQPHPLFSGFVKAAVAYREK